MTIWTPIALMDSSIVIINAVAVSVQILRARSCRGVNDKIFIILMSSWNILYPIVTATATDKMGPIQTSEGVHIAVTVAQKTRMHSRMMRTARLLPISPSMHCSGGYTCWGGGTCQGVYLPRVCTCLGVHLPRGCTCPGGVPSQGVYLPRGCTCPGVTYPGVYLPREGTCPGTPPVDRQTRVKT